MLYPVQHDRRSIAMPRERSNPSDVSQFTICRLSQLLRVNRNLTCRDFMLLHRCLPHTPASRAISASRSLRFRDTNHNPTTTPCDQFLTICHSPTLYPRVSKPSDCRHIPCCPCCLCFDASFYCSTMETDLISPFKRSRLPAHAHQFAHLLLNETHNFALNLY